MRQAAIAILFSLFLAASARADVVVTVKKDYYTVDGTDIRTIYNNLKVKSPLVKMGRSFTAETRSKLNWKAQFEKRGGICKVKKSTLYLDIVYFYPKLAHSVDRKTRNWWREMMKTLEIHELIHGDISKRSAHDIDSRLERVSPADCNELKAKMRAIIEQGWRKQRDDQIAYDKLTDHGLKQDKYKGPQPAHYFQQ